MATGQIRITPELMEGRAAEYEREAENLQDIISRMDRLLQELQTEWEGMAAEAYAGKFQELRPGFLETKELILNIAGSLRSTANVIRETDSEIAGRFNA